MRHSRNQKTADSPYHENHSAAKPQRDRIEEYPSYKAFLNFVIFVASFENLGAEGTCGEPSRLRRSASRSGP
jgi:hypothetical protein